MTRHEETRRVRMVPEAWHRFIESQRLRMAHFEALPQLALMGVVSGLLAGAVIILFRLLVEIGAGMLFPMSDEEAFESLKPEWRFLVATGGGLVVGLLFHFVGSSTRQVGVVHVIERLNYHQGLLPLRNAVLQFIGAAVSILCGHSVGREGPAIHLGAASGSLLGSRLGLPNNSIRTLVGCGVAAAIAAGFNTPLAGVIFAMEVVLMEYTIIGFAPIILAAVSATALTRLVYGEGIVFFVYAYEWKTIDEFFYVLVLGAVIGVIAAGFIRLTVWISNASERTPIWLRLLIAGAMVGLIAVPVPEVMGIGYDTARAALLGEVALTPLLLIAVCKVFATGICIGLGSPGGLIAPTLVIGASAGGALGWVTIGLFGADIADGSYAMLGMGAMMAATLQAPLAALVALLELTANPGVIMPGMTAVITAILVTRVAFRSPSIYQLMMGGRGKDYRNDPVSQTLRRIGVASVMDRSFESAPPVINRADADTVLATKPQWILIREGEEAVALLPASDLARHLKEHEHAERIELMEIPAMRKDLARISIVASLNEARELLELSGKEALYVTGARRVGLNRIHGVLTREHIEKSYRY